MEMEMETKFTALRIIAHNNYTLRNEQHIRIMGYKLPNLTRQKINKLFDIAIGEGVGRRGYSGMGAGAEVYLEDNDGDEIRCESPRETLELLLAAGYQIPEGSLMVAYKFRAKLERKEFWDGNNHIGIRAVHTRQFIAAMRLKAGRVI